MSQFDVYPNPSPKTRSAFPYIVDIQNPLISDIATRIVIPLRKEEHFRQEEMKGLTPKIKYQGSQLLLLTPQIRPLPATLQKNSTGI